MHFKVLLAAILIVLNPGSAVIPLPECLRENFGCFLPNYESPREYFYCLRLNEEPIKVECQPDILFDFYKQYCVDWNSWTPPPSEHPSRVTCMLLEQPPSTIPTTISSEWTSSADSSSSQSTPEQTKTTPDITRTSPEITRTSPEVTRSTPEVTRTTPEVTRTTSESSTETPTVPSATRTTITSTRRYPTFPWRTTTEPLPTANTPPLTAPTVGIFQ